MKKNCWISAEEIKSILDIVSTFKADGCLTEVELIEEVLDYLDSVPNMILSDDNFREYYLTEKDYKQLVELYNWYCIVVRTIIEYESNEKIEKSFAVLRKYVSEFKPMQCLQINKPQVSHQGFGVIYPMVKNCTSLKDVLLVAISQCTYLQYEEFVETYMCMSRLGFNKKNFKFIKKLPAKKTNPVCTSKSGEDFKSVLILIRETLMTQAEMSKVLSNNEQTSNNYETSIPSILKQRPLEYMPIRKR